MMKNEKKNRVWIYVKFVLILLAAGAVGGVIGYTAAANEAFLPRAVARLGCCRPTEEGYTSEISARLLPAGEKAVREVLAHEVIHTCRGCGNHGPRWQTYAGRMNRRWGYHVSRTGTWESLGLPEQKPARYVLVCTRCGAEFIRARASSLVRHPERYRCRCGGQLELKQGPEGK